VVGWLGWEWEWEGNGRRAALTLDTKPASNKKYIGISSSLYGSVRKYTIYYILYNIPNIRMTEYQKYSVQYQQPEEKMEKTGGRWTLTGWIPDNQQSTLDRRLLTRWFGNNNTGFIIILLYLLDFYGTCFAQ